MAGNPNHKSGASDVPNSKIGLEVQGYAFTNKSRSGQLFSHPNGSQVLLHSGGSAHYSGPGGKGGGSAPIHAIPLIVSRFK